MIFWFNADELILGVEVFGVCPVCPLAEFIWLDPTEPLDETVDPPVETILVFF